MNANTATPPQPLSRKFKNLIKSQFHSVFAAGQRLGFDILPRHFYSEIPDLHILKNTNSWRSPFTMLGVLGASPEEQFAWVEEVVASQLRQRFTQSNIHRQACL